MAFFRWLGWWIGWFLRNRSAIASACSLFYFVFIMLPVAFFLLPISIFWSIAKIFDVIQIGFSGTSGMVMVFLITLFIAPSMLIPGVKRMYQRLPWLEAYCVQGTLDLTILIIALEILNFGYSVVSTQRHVLFIGFMLLWIIGARALQCWWFNRHPITYIKEGSI